MARVDLATLKELIGHTSINTTSAPEHKRQAMEKLEQFNVTYGLAQAEIAGPHNFPHSDPV